jgi:hypothetical protein
VVLGEDTSLVATVRVGQLAAEIRNLRASLKRLEDGADEWRALAAPVEARLSDLTQQLIGACSSDTREFALKAAVVLDWLDPNLDDVPTLLAASLCRDAVLLFGASDA